jgi:hypothetical protein
MFETFGKDAIIWYWFSVLWIFSWFLNWHRPQWFDWIEQFEYSKWLWILIILIILSLEFRHTYGGKVPLGVDVLESIGATHQLREWEGR